LLAKPHHLGRDHSRQAGNPPVRKSDFAAVKTQKRFCSYENAKANLQLNIMLQQESGSHLSGVLEACTTRKPGVAAVEAYNEGP
jgi:hypothetical protein